VEVRRLAQGGQGIGGPVGASSAPQAQSFAVRSSFLSRAEAPVRSFFVVVVPGLSRRRGRSAFGQSAGGEFEEGLGQGLTSDGRLGDDEDRVVSGDGAEDTEGRGTVD